MTTKKPAAKKAAVKKTADRPSTAVMASNLRSTDTANSDINVVKPQVEIAPGISLMPSLMISASLVPFKKAADELTAMASRAVINSTDSYERGIAFMTLARDKSRQLESYRVSVKGPIDDYGRFIQSLFKPLIDQMDLAGKDVSRKMLTHKQEQDRIANEEAAQRRRDSEAAAARLAEELAAKGQTEQAEAVREAVAAAPAPVAQSTLAHVRTGGVAAQTRKTWVGSIDKPMAILQAIVDGKLPVSLIEFRQAELNQFARDLKIAGVHLGIKVEETESLGIR